MSDLSSGRRRQQRRTPSAVFVDRILDRHSCCMISIDKASPNRGAARFVPRVPRLAQTSLFNFLLLGAFAFSKTYGVHLAVYRHRKRVSDPDEAAKSRGLGYSRTSATSTAGGVADPRDVPRRRRAYSSDEVSSPR